MALRNAQGNQGQAAGAPWVRPDALGTGLAGLEPTTYGLGNRRSIRLSYSPFNVIMGCWVNHAAGRKKGAGAQAETGKCGTPYSANRLEGQG